MSTQARITKVKQGRHIVGYCASIGPIDGHGKTPAEAKEACAIGVSGALARLERGALIGRWHGHLYAVSPTTNGWSYWIDTFSSTDYSVEINGDRERAIDAALTHLGQHAWNLTIEDDAAFFRDLPRDVTSELLRWAAWQRRYSTAKVNGLTDHEAHRAASENSA